jgi:hypothetical protein
MWFCVVLALAIGWASHFRYSLWMEKHFVGEPSVTDDDLRKLMNDAVQVAKELREDNYAYRYAVERMLDKNQLKQLEKEKNKYRSMLEH